MLFMPELDTCIHAHCTQVNIHTCILVLSNVNQQLRAEPHANEPKIQQKGRGAIKEKMR